MPPLRFLVPFLLTFACAPALAQHSAPGTAAATPSAPGGAGRRFPQPVRAGDLPGRQLLRPVEAQDLLGHVSHLVRRPDGAVLVVVDTGGLLGLGTRPVAVPLAAVALLGEHLALEDLTPDQFRALPTFDPAGTEPVPPDQVLRIGLTRPFH